MTKSRKKVLFVLYVVLIGVILLYALFPSDAVRNAIANRIQQAVPDLRVDVGDLNPAFPFSLSMEDVMFSKKGTPLFSADRLTLKPRWLSMLSSGKEIKVDAVAYGGKISGVISLMQGSENGSVSIKGTFSDLQLEQISALQENIDAGLSGSASGRLHLDDVSARQTFGSGSFSVTDCTVALPSPIMEIDRLSFQKIDLAFDIEGNRVELQQGDFLGQELSAVVAGSISIESPADRSVMDLDIIVTPERLFLSKLDDKNSAGLLTSLLSEQGSFNLGVTGSMASPRYTFGAAR